MLKPVYVTHGVVLILLPMSVFAFLIIVVLKLICVFFTDGRRRGLNGSKPYGAFDDDVEETEEVASVYFKIMEKIKFTIVEKEGF